MHHDILAVLREKAPSFSKGQRAIARYITESYDQAAFMTANRLGKTVGVSESTVVRFAMDLGYDGYPQMQKAMQDMVVNRLSPALSDEMAQDMLSMVLQSDAEKLLKTEQTVNRQEFQAAVDALENAKNIYVLGIRLADTLVNYLGYYLNYLFPNVRTVTPSAGEIFEQIIAVRPGDAVVIFSDSRHVAATAKAAGYCRSKGAKVIGVTDSSFSALGQSCDHVLLTKSNLLSFVDSLVAPMSVANALILNLAAGREKELAKTLHELEYIREEYNVYEKQDGYRDV